MNGIRGDDFPNLVPLNLRVAVALLVSPYANKQCALLGAGEKPRLLGRVWHDSEVRNSTDYGQCSEDEMNYTPAAERPVLNHEPVANRVHEDDGKAIKAGPYHTPRGEVLMFGEELTGGYLERRDDN